ncbi:Ada metal-binding domain-containing protein [Sphingobacterium sp.]|uniref:Ada metal-binding domain-containing protein n=1 Tax=Sphingobacterium sp. TaxID=341027 RepID=UPI0031CE4801
MVRHIDLAVTEAERKKILSSLIRKGEITLGGYKKAKIYGHLNCAAGKRMKAEYRVFFKDELDAISNGYRPCGRCMREKYKQWKAKQQKGGHA